MTNRLKPEAGEAAELAAAREQLMELARILGRAGAEAAHRLGLQFDVNNPEGARDLLLATFQGVLLSKRPERRRRSSKVADGP